MRGRPAPKRYIAPDPRYGNVIVEKLTNTIMERGKKTVARSIVYGAFELIAEKTKKDPIEVFDAALKNVMPAMEVKSRRVGGANYQIPLPVRGERKQALAFRWIMTGAQSVKGKPMHIKLANEIMAAANNEGVAVKKRMDVQRMADANRAFAHFAR